MDAVATALCRRAVASEAESDDTRRICAPGAISAEIPFPVVAAGADRGPHPTFIRIPVSGPRNEANFDKTKPSDKMAQSGS